MWAENICYGELENYTFGFTFSFNSIYSQFIDDLKIASKALEWLQRDCIELYWMWRVGCWEVSPL